MPIETPDALFQALRSCGLFTPEQLLLLVREAAPHGPDLAAVLRGLVDRGRATSYQLRKVLAGRAEDLFLGPYVLTDKLGKGGMGRVYRARHARTRRQVALKVVHPALVSSPTVRGRYLREAEAAGALRHRNLVRLEDAGEDRGRYYLAMEFVDGLDLARLLRDYPQLEVEEACEYARQAAQGLHHAHRAGFVHRDVKPSNIIVAGERHVPQATEPAVVKVTDLGLVRVVGLADDAAAEELTRDGTVVGTPDYMAPEQAKNSSAVDHRADLYSLGCTLYFLLAGRPPFADGTAVEKLLKHQLDDPLPVQEYRPEVPDVLAAVVAKLMAKDPADRFASAAAAAAALAPLAVYPRGARPVPITVRRPVPVPAPDSAGTASRPGSSAQVPAPPARPAAPVPVAQPVAPSDPTPRPLALPDQVPDSPFAVLNDPRSDDDDDDDDVPPAPAATLSRPVWAALAGLVAVAGAVGVWAVTRSGRPEPTVPPPTDPPKVARPAPPPAARPHPPAALVPDGATLVAVVHPGAHLRDRTSPLASGAGPGKLADWVDHVEKTTALPLARADRMVLSVPAGAPDQFLLAAEGDFLTPKFADRLDAEFATFKPVGKAERGVKRYLTQSGGLEVGLFTPVPPAGPVYAVATAPGLVEQLGPRLLGPRPAAPQLDPRIVSALAPPPGAPPPALLVVATGDWRPPGPDPKTLKDLGLDLLTVRARAADRGEVEVTGTGPTGPGVKSGLEAVANRLAGRHPALGPSVAELLGRGEATGAPLEKGFRITVRATMTPEQWSDFLEGCFAP
ncbi:MAG: hypothetical protein C0501_18175 [Isosphaera sp.]|nr:hypothetical protein [Isosphaera sp.]